MKLREMYRLDYEKVQLLLSKKKDIIKERTAGIERFQKENDELINNKGEKEEKI